MNEQSDPFDELMRRSLAEEADRIEPTDALPEILTRAHAVRRPVVRRPWVVTAGLAAVGTAAAVGAFTVFNGNLNTANEGDAVAGPGTVTSATGVPVVPPETPRSQSATAPTEAPTDRSTTPEPKRSISEPAVSDKAVAVYWLGDAAAGRPMTKPSVQARSSTRLYRTFSRVSGRPAYEAVEIMTTQQPDDADYYSLWKGAKVKSVSTDGDVITVDFERFPAATKIDPTVAEVAAQQLVYTVQGALGESTQPVQVLQQGRAGARLFGQVDTSEPLLRAQAADVRALVSIESPTDGTVTSSGLVTVKGQAAAYEATVNYVATNPKTGQTFKDAVKTTEGQKFAPFTFQLKLEPGQWQIEAYLLSGDNNAISDLDTKTILVR